MTTEKVYTVLELNTEVRSVIKDKFPEQIWVCGEIQDLRIQRGKNHMYFSLVQKDPDSDSIVARVDANLWAGNRPLIEKRIGQAQAAFELKDDIEVKFLCEVGLYAPRGKYSVNVKDIDPVYTLGKVAQNRLKIIEDLRKRGLLEKNKLKTLPLVALSIGLITADDSAAYHDFINELSLSGYSFKVLACNCHMQGKLVEPDVLRAMDFFNDLASNKLDAIVITRGGGSIADLSYFDNKKISQAIANCDFPVISAIGHQINTTIADMVAHTFCKTPTKAAQFLVEKVRAVVERLDYAEEAIIREAQACIGSSKKSLHNLTMRVESAAVHYFKDHRERLLAKKHAVASSLEMALMKNKDLLKRFLENAGRALEKIFRNKRDHLNHARDKIKILNPQNTLKRGYSITVKEGKALKSIDDVAESDTIKTLLFSGNILSTVNKKERSNEQEDSKVQ